jgi:hypothetical protein
MGFVLLFRDVNVRKNSADADLIKNGRTRVLDIKKPLVSEFCSRAYKNKMPK